MFISGQMSIFPYGDDEQSLFAENIFLYSYTVGKLLLSLADRSCAEEHDGYNSSDWKSSV